MDESFFGRGALPDKVDMRDYTFDGIAKTTLIDWDKGYDIRNELGDDVPYKNQFTSNSCVGQAYAIQAWVYQILEMMAKYKMDLKQLRIEHAKEVDEISAKAVYSQIFIASGGGAYIRDGAKILCDWGAVFNGLVPSYKADGTTDESFMTDRSWKTDAISNIAKIMQGKDYRVIVAKGSMDLMAQAILENKGVVGGVYGVNNGTWLTERPKPPTAFTSDIWGHAIDYLAFGKDQYGKFIATPNSWGDLQKQKWYKGAPPGYGWQKIYQDYFVEDGRWTFNPWTYTDKLNINDNDMQLFKKKGTGDIYEKWYDGKYRKGSGPSYIANRYGTSGLNIIEIDIPENLIAGTIGEEEWFKNTPINKW
jgi:hypothetical protein